MRLLPVALLLPLAASTVLAAITEIPLPPSARMPLALEFDLEGRLWLTLDETWAVGRFDPSTGAITVAKLATPKATPQDSLVGIALGPDGAVWTGSATHLHRIDPQTLNATSFRLPVESALPGDVHLDHQGIVWYASVTEDTIVRLDPRTGQTSQHLAPRTPFGPLHFGERGSEVYVSGTYYDGYARLDTTNGTLRPEGPGTLLSPVGLTDDGQGLWFAEMGGSSVARVELGTGKVERYPTAPSPYYPISGPSGIAVADDGIVWFVEHFADRLARLDLQDRTLVEWEVPSSPGSNMQNLALAPNGSVWFAEWSKHQLGWTEPVDPEVDLVLPPFLTVTRGNKVEFDFDEPDELVFGNPHDNLTARREGDRVIVDASSAPAGAYNLLVSVKDGKIWAGKYIAVHVSERVASGGGEANTPSTAGALLVLSLAATALLAWRKP